MTQSVAAAVANLSAVTTTASGEAVELGDSKRTIHVTGTTSSGTGSATIVVEVSNDTTWPWLTADTLTLTLGTTATASGTLVDADWKYIRLRVSAISGTGASVSGKIGY